MPRMRAAPATAAATVRRRGRSNAISTNKPATRARRAPREPLRRIAMAPVRAAVAPRSRSAGERISSLTVWAAIVGVAAVEVAAAEVAAVEVAALRVADGDVRRARPAKTGQTRKGA